MKEPRKAYPITLTLTHQAADMIMVEWHKLKENGKQIWTFDRVVSRIVNELAKGKTPKPGRPIHEFR